MLANYLILLAGGGLIDAVYLKKRRSDVLNLPLWMSGQYGGLLVDLLALLSTVGSIFIGIIFINWWTGIFSWFVADLIIIFLLQRVLFFYRLFFELFIAYGLFIGIAVYIFGLIKIIWS